MGALPKNKITRAERGKRRAGNKPKVLKDSHTHQIPRQKKSLFAAMMASMGYSKAAPVKEKQKKNATVGQKLTNIDQKTSAAAAMPSGVDKSKHRAQHKG